MTEILIASTFTIILGVVFFYSRNRVIRIKTIPSLYRYMPKAAIMTRAEGRFFERLTHVTGDRFFVMPQAHLSSFLDHKIKGQNWHAAFSTINGKSVDFLLVEKTTLRPAIAIELDDWSHSKEERVDRDYRVTELLTNAGIMLVRFDNPDASEREIIDMIYNLASEKNTQN